MTTRSYSPGAIYMVCGIYIFKSWESIEIDYDDLKWIFKKGMYGELIRTKVPGKAGTITITMKQTSAGNTYNTALNVLLNDTFGVSGLVPIFILDYWNKPVHLMPKATILKVPKATYGKALSDRQWVFKGNLELHSLAVLNTAGETS